MKVSDLTIGHIGEHITVTSPAGVTAGRLVSIEADAEVLHDRANLGDVNTLGAGDLMIGQTTVYLTIGYARLRVRLDAGVDVG